MKKVIKCFLIISLFTLTQVSCTSLDARYGIKSQQFCDDIMNQRDNRKIYNQCVSRLKDQYTAQHESYMLQVVMSSIFLSVLGIFVAIDK